MALGFALFSTLLAGGWESRELVQIYFHNSEIQSQWAWSTFAHYRLRGDEEVLQIGSGDGKISAALANLLPEGSVTGLDTSKEMIRFSKRMFHKSNLTFLQVEDANYFDCALGKTFDLVTAFSSLHTLTTPSHALHAIHAHMKPGAALLITLPLKLNPFFTRALSKECTERQWALPFPSQEMVKLRSADGVKHLLETEGFAIDFFEVEETSLPFSSREELVAWCEGTFGSLWDIPNEERHDFFEEVINLYIEYCPSRVDEEGYIFFPLSQLSVVARS